MIFECHMCRSLNVGKTYRDGLYGYYHKGRNRKLENPNVKSSAPYIEKTDEHFECYCLDCGYGWIKEIKK